MPFAIRRSLIVYCMLPLRKVTCAVRYSKWSADFFFARSSLGSLGFVLVRVRRRNRQTHAKKKQFNAS